ncbi:SusC/RagA family TonB-linked outer membrane protein [Membranicola marinus]|uniref:SusC/RagA family TonB-linked outer membrane protein n=1 Tax=Membranihabitans marinus TaxID=1227546 RepID=A0A953LBA5_9BACT|nr:SusC/RagA family TonB-linked outer membrane protein [Membranihabitans marinus]MBY5959548.1 SusC/RagA family TonB-linked outer membrane protein [Membranihabitans marinus]
MIKQVFLNFIWISLFLLVAVPTGFSSDVLTVNTGEDLSQNNFVGGVSGKVTDEEGEPLIGVNVVVQDSNNGTSTDFDGNYMLENVDDDAVLVFSYVGYQTQEVEVEGRSVIDVNMVSDAQLLDELVVVGYGTVKKSDLTGSVQRLSGEKFENQNLTQVGEMLAGTVAGFSANQSASPAGGSSMEIRGPTSLTAGTSPMIVLDGVIYNGSLRDINPADIATIDILKDASSAAIFGAEAASGVVLITTVKGKAGKPVINFSTKFGIAQPTYARKPYSPEEFIQFRADYFRTINPGQNYDYYTNPENLPENLSVSEWRDLSQSPLPDNTDEYLRRLNFFPIEQEQYKAGQTTDWYDVVIRNGVRQSHDLSLSGGSDRTNYYWSLGYVDNEGLRLGDEYSAIRSRMNVDFDVTDWLNVGVNAQFSDRDEGGVPASYVIYSNSPYGRVYSPNGNLERLAHGHTFNPLINYFRDDRYRKVNSLFTNLFADVKLPLDITYKLSFQPRYETMKELFFRSTDPRLGGDPAQDQSIGRRNEYSRQEWILDNILKWNGEFGAHDFDVTLLYSAEQNKFWSTQQANQNISPNEELGYHGLQFGDGPTIDNNDRIFTGEAFMARINYTLMDKYLLTASIRRDGYSAFGQEQPRATFPAAALAWQISRENFYDEDWFVNRLKLRLSWGSNGNRDIGIYSALARLNSDLWFDGTTPRVGLYNSTLANPGLVWEKTNSFNIGLDIGLMADRFDLSIDVYDATTTNLLMNRRLPILTGFTNITTNLGKLSNKGVELTFNSNNITAADFKWNSSFVFSLNRNKIIALFGDKGEYTLLGEQRNGELPDYSNQWFPGYAIDAVWDYERVGVWQVGEEDEAAKYVMRPGDFKSVDVNQDGKYRPEDDKQFIGFRQPRFRLGLGNDFSILENWTLSVFLRADLGHIGAESGALNPGNESNDRRGRNVGPLPYWTPQNPINDYARLDLHTGGYGGGIQIYRPRSFFRLQDISLSYRVPSDLVEMIKIENLRVFASARNVVTVTKWPNWDPESGSAPMPKSYNFGINLSL